MDDLVEVEGYLKAWDWKTMDADKVVTRLERKAHGLSTSRRAGATDVMH